MDKRAVPGRRPTMSKSKIEDEIFKQFKDSGWKNLHWKVWGGRKKGRQLSKSQITLKLLKPC